MREKCGATRRCQPHLEDSHPQTLTPIQPLVWGAWLRRMMESLQCQSIFGFTRPKLVGPNTNIDTFDRWTLPQAPTKWGKRLTNNRLAHTCTHRCCTLLGGGGRITQCNPLCAHIHLAARNTLLVSHPRLDAICPPYCHSCLAQQWPPSQEACSHTASGAITTSVCMGNQVGLEWRARLHQQSAAKRQAHKHQTLPAYSCLP